MALHNFQKARSWFRRMRRGLWVSGPQKLLLHVAVYYFATINFEENYERLKVEIAQIIPMAPELPYDHWIFRALIMEMGLACSRTNDLEQAEKRLHHLVYTLVTERGLLHEKTYKIISSLARVKQA
jgi:hypothetical protein